MNLKDIDTYPPCPIEVGDTFYRNDFCAKHGMSIPDRVEVMSIERLPEPMVIREAYTDEKGEHHAAVKGFYKIHGRYMYHAIGPVFERDFIDALLRGDGYTIEKRAKKKAS